MRAITSMWFVSCVSAKTFCPDKLKAVYADMHDGDEKEVEIDGSAMTIRPSGNDQTWVVNAELDTESCSAIIDFNVPGKPGPPPVNLTATLWYSLSASEKKTEFEFTDPSGTLADATFPLNHWVEESKKEVFDTNLNEKTFCPDKLKAVYADMHDGDEKEVEIDGNKMTIKPSGNDQTWVVNAEVDVKSCSAVIDFNVPGKPGPPPVNLTATLWYSLSASEKKTEFEFTDPSGTLADAAFPLNRWVKIPVTSSNEKTFCPDKLKAVYADMHDGDEKEVEIDGTAMTIKPSGNDQTWVVNAQVDIKSCSAVIDFNVPGKPGPPPVNLTATLWYSLSASEKKTEFEFTDPSGTLADATFPLNRWVEESEKDSSVNGKTFCPDKLKAIYADMHDGDEKEVEIDGSALTIKPSGNDQTWVVNSVLDTKSCSAIIDFNVPGKPGPPPVNLTATLLYSVSASEKKTEFEFTDPSGTLADATFPLNHWVAVSKKNFVFMV